MRIVARHNLFISAVVAALAGATRAEEVKYKWNSLSHPYQSYYLEDYCGVANATNCDSESYTVFVSSAGSSSGLVVNGFRDDKPHFNQSTRCCITVKALDLTRFNVQLDEVTVRQAEKPGDLCDNFVKIGTPEKELDLICGKVQSRAFKTEGNELTIEYFFDSSELPQYQQIKLIVTGSEDADAEGGQCNATRQQMLCDDGGCIWEGFRCDGQNNCGDASDENGCGFFARYWPWIGFVAGHVLMIIVCCTCCCCCKKRRSRTAELYSKLTSASGQPVKNNYQFVPSLAPPTQPVIGKVYPSLDAAYQRDAGKPSNPSTPPMYGPSTHLPPPPYNSNYGAIKS